jgi:hypothetical protein
MRNRALALAPRPRRRTLVSHSKPVEHDVGQIATQDRYWGIAFAGSRTRPAEAGSNRARRIDAVGLRRADRNDPR